VGREGKVVGQANGNYHLQLTLCNGPDN